MELEELALVCQTGRKRGLGLMVNTQVPTKLHGSILSQVSEWVCFRLGFKRSLEMMEEQGFNVEELSALPDLHFIARTDVGAELRGHITI
jgi:DNA helicase HerA-like ATPase